MARLVESAGAAQEAAGGAKRDPPGRGVGHRTFTEGESGGVDLGNPDTSEEAGPKKAPSAAVGKSEAGMEEQGPMKKVPVAVVPLGNV